MKLSQLLCLLSCALGAMCLLFSSCATLSGGGTSSVTLMTLDPGHFHAALVQKTMYPHVRPNVFIYAPAGQDLLDHLSRIEAYNSRPISPTRWASMVCTETNYLERMLAEKRGNVVVIAGNNARKAEYINACVSAGLHVLADKPMAITAGDFKTLRASFDTAQKRRVILCDIMTERYETTTVLQRELSMMPSLFGSLDRGTQEEPAVTEESVHYFCKLVSGSPLKRPAWFFDVAQQGEGIVDIATHLVDLIQWECFPDKAIDWRNDVTVLDAHRWPTRLSRKQFSRVTTLDSFPDYLKNYVDKGGMLNVCANGKFNYMLRGVHAKVSVRWEFEAPAGAGDTHQSVMRGTKATIAIRQGAEEHYKPALYVEKAGKTTDSQLRTAVKDAVAELEQRYPGISLEQKLDRWQVVVPESYNVGHEAHFAQVMDKFLNCLNDGELAAWEVPNMLAKYYTTTAAYEMSR